MSGQARGRAPETELTEFEIDSTKVALIADVANERAWIQSTETVTVEP